MTDASVAFNRFFGVSPPKTLEGRPECTAMLLEWLLDDREQILKTLIEHDLNTRSLQKSCGKTALDTLSSLDDCVKRRIDFELLKRSLHLFYFSKGKDYIIGHGTFSSISKRAMDLLTDTAVTD
eukprot:54305-Pyramimonas_sp.AAC.1